ncbi:MAG TPA: hypothetical protein VE967_19430 [Gemmatimonadaceae bacterium]|nr:hypothetical protein [Gemmatimonadaceae bacterium]
MKKISERIKERTSARLLSSGRDIVSPADHIPEILDALDALAAPWPPATMGVRPDANATVTSSTVNGERVFLIYVFDRKGVVHSIELDRTTLVDLWRAIEAAS